ncbi:MULTISPECIES: tyrosine-protein phosphatase [Terrabacteria group]|uniref:tyrosine-protein phosphatase n=1 Tax=Bacillati TaxID=1783272 RepID=UPI001C6EC3BA|nr:MULTISPECIES: tyrosine-protein phosphatase [Terrabacteria group]MBW9212517.1 tyrosine-protein phosphatase [Trueperella sp. zg.1013]
MNAVRKELNLRDLGNIPTRTGRKIKEGLFYRSSGLNKFNEQDLEIVKAMGLKKIIDLRSKEERMKSPDPDLGVPIIYFDSYRAKYMDDINFGFDGMLRKGKEGLHQQELRVKYYENMPFGNPYLKKAMELIQEDNVPFLFHCASGKDRTGVMAIVILGLFEVEQEKMIEDYLLTNLYRKSIIDQAFSERASLLQEYPELKGPLLETFGVKSEMGLAIISSILNRYGGFDQYYEQEFGIDAELRKTLIECYTEK